MDTCEYSTVSSNVSFLLNLKKLVKVVVVDSAIFVEYLQLLTERVIDFPDVLLSKQQHKLDHVWKTKIFSTQLYSSLLSLIEYWEISLMYINAFLSFISCCSSTLDYTGIQGDFNHVIVKHGVVCGADLLFLVDVFWPFSGYHVHSV